MSFLQKSFLLFSTFIIFSMCTCQKTSEDTLKNWLGLWSAHENTQLYFLDVKEGSESSYEISGQSVVYGSVSINTSKNTLSIKSKTFNINTYPTLNSTLNKYQATLDGLVFTKN